MELCSAEKLILSRVRSQGIVCHAALSAGHVVSAGPVQATQGAGSSPCLFFIQGTEKEMLLLPLSSFCLQHSWLKAAKWIKFIISCAERAAAMPGSSGSLLEGGPSRPPTPLYRVGSKRASCSFFIIKCIIIEAFPSFLIGLAVCQFSELASDWFCRAQRS